MPNMRLVLAHTPTMDQHCGMLQQCILHCLHEKLLHVDMAHRKRSFGFPQVLRDIRGIDDVEEEFGDIRAACTKAASVINPWRTICRRAYAPQLFIAITATLFQQWTGAEFLFLPLSPIPMPGGACVALVLPNSKSQWQWSLLLPGPCAGILLTSPYLLFPAAVQTPASKSRVLN